MTETELSIAFVGDVYWGERPSIRLHPDVVEVLASADLVVANQEGPITHHAGHVGGKCVLRSAPETAELLRSSGVDVVSLANNHVFDFGWEGFEETRRLLATADVACVGAGENLQEASRPLVRKVKGANVGLLAYAWEFIETTCATEHSFGCAPLDLELMVSQTRELAREVDAVIVMPHWGLCDYQLPTPQQVAMGRCLIEAGAAAVVGHHSHVSQGVVVQGDAVVAYSLGNFLFEPFMDRGSPARFSRDNLEGMILRIELQGNRVVATDVVFTRQTEGQIVVHDVPRRRDEMSRRSALPVTQDYGRRWKRYVRGRLCRRLLHHANIMNWHRIRRGTLVGGWVALKEMFGRRG